MSQSRRVWRPAYVGLGSNLENPARQIEAAFELLRGIPETRLIARSPLYDTAPFGVVEQPDFVNAAAALLTCLEPLDLLAKFQEIERSQGREQGGQRWGPRILDLDLLAFGDVVTGLADGVLVPHPRMHERAFVLLPLRDLAPGWRHPVSGLGVGEHIAALPPGQVAEPMD
ncbi:MAG: 2-amino-4-hydroxy-6-hydroxymethyldihydropteridine diphosphokinase, partial [Proteobacteria bacterium]|nr:2-amino-4-hydroxy-6-hydroxymethyldihydropteridine diphosphokinase [Pseudomonadota bacterium]